MTATSSPAIKLLSQIDLIPDELSKDALFERLKKPQTATTVAFVNAHAVNIMWSNSQIADDFLAADIVLRDGKGLQILFDKLGVAPGLNMNGTDFLPAFLQHTKDMPLAVYGTADPWLSKGCQSLEQDGHTIVSREDGFKPVQAYVDAALDAQPKIILLAMGMPKQEKVARALRDAFGQTPVTILCGGAIVDFIAGRFPRAPSWVRNLGFEWAYRLLREPRRLFRRYVLGNVVFLRHVRSIERAGGLPPRD
ncbi:exopolysaccharide biosynthesis WecB/TagA/CpsF family protein [Pacificibacter maritimus]|uniref:Exopolysaccharide biosynthesis WecB/TagA/CpsF family protein n=1 Tax=Pacificibacter maritimus TaxID=762213 RepID=A0A3N4UPA8_9RHOB|nr:WecB/TagA/CpsF family glycosyltransferase [Pacificibacter maritimus]RPE71868.1 exopolysaccharide biosynthesis WecB/TagA/CpsF family protein [Pacificibacter maritimus]